MAFATTSGGITWAVPVRPDILCQNLQAYKTALPVLNALRLCHRFGQGPDVHVTKLPVEIEQAIEDIIFNANLSRLPFADAFEHFESRCMPVDHLDDEYGELYFDVRDEIHEKLCEKCKAEDEDDFDFDNEICIECLVEIHMEMNERMCEYGFDWRYDDCVVECAKWTDLINQNPNGKFVPYDKMVLEHFRLEVYFATTRANKLLGKDSWPDEMNHMYHDEDELKTTICYLTTPSPMGYKTKYETSDMEDDMPTIDIHGSASCLVELPTSQEKEKRTAQFKRAMRTLRLKPYVHPSQLTPKPSAASSVKESPEKELEQSNETKADSGEKAALDVEWPQLVMLSKISFESHY